MDSTSGTHGWTRETLINAPACQGLPHSAHGIPELLLRVRLSLEDMVEEPEPLAEPPRFDILGYRAPLKRI